MVVIVNVPASRRVKAVVRVVLRIRVVHVAVVDRPIIVVLMIHGPAKVMKLPC